MVKMNGSIHWRELAMAQQELAKLANHYAQSKVAEGKATRTIEGTATPCPYIPDT